MRYALNRGRPGTDYAHALIGELMEAAGGVPARVVIVPTTGVESVSLKLLDPRDPGELGPIQRSARHDHKTRLKQITAIGRDCPAFLFVVPARILDLRLEARVLIEVEMLSDPLCVLENLGCKRVLLLGHIPGLFEEWQINVGFDVALSAGVAIPVPGTAKIPSFLDDTGLSDADLLEPRRGKQAAEAASDDHGVELLAERWARDRFDVM